MLVRKGSRKLMRLVTGYSSHALILLVGLGLLPGALHPPRTVVDARTSAIDGFRRCVEGPSCKASEVFVSPEAQADWAQAEPKVRAVQVKTMTLVQRVPAPWATRWQADWTRHLPDLVAAGYRKAEIERLGAGAAIVQASDRVALALVAVELTRGGRTKTEHLVLVLWQTRTGYGVAYFEDAIRKVAAFMQKWKPT
jgi:hypothetical protein